MLQDLGNIVGHYAGDGQGEAESVSQAVDIDILDSLDADSDIDDLEMEQRDESSDAKPLLFLYDCETTGFSIYNDHTIEIAAEVVNCPVACSNGTFSSLVKTSRRIPAAGILHIGSSIFIYSPAVTKITNITPTMILFLWSFLHFLTG